ncbi:MAG TPA: saccharopine dehydrogenase family protein [bacterium]|nr:saccharopine dehydrogenase family protein [bacterium]HOL47581.1 saccharopine dehydrogenase family protein [bacterium]HPQ18843.1 saccharopine dehydrogenase family protein [bacterium]
MSKVLVIGAGGVSGVVVHKCSQVPEVFSEILLASRTIEKCERIKNQIKNSKTKIYTAQVDADKPENVIKLINEFKPELVINVALPYQDLSIMDACLATGVDYLDTANYEPPDTAKFEYKWQWAYKDKYKEKGIMALLGCGFDPGATNVFCAYAQKHYFDEIHYIDIIDANAADNGQYFATNFNPEINIREVTAKGKYWENGDWCETPPLFIHKEFDFPIIGKREIYLMYHEELESLVKNIKGLKRIRFWMTFSDRYLKSLEVLQAIGMTSIKPIKYQGMEIVPLQFLKAVLPDPATLGPLTRGKTCIGCLIEGIKDGKKRKYYIYNICDHQECYKEVQSQAVSYTTGVPAMIGAMLILQKIWHGKGVFNVEEFDPDPFIERMNKYGLPVEEKFLE